MVRAFLLLAVLVAAAHASSFRGAWVFDDAPGILDRKDMDLTWTNLRGEVGRQRPVVKVSFMIDRAIGGRSIRPFHATNLAIHVAAALALFELVRRSLAAVGRAPDDARALAFAIALLWGVHPLATESVVYVSQRAQSLMSLFQLLFLLAFVRSRGSRHRTGWLVASVASFLLGLLCKPHLVFAPALALLHERAFEGVSLREALRRSRGFYGSLALVWLLGVAYLARGLARKGWADVGAQGVTPGGYALAQCEVVPHYARLVLWPDRLCIDHAWPAPSLAHALPWALGLGLLVALTAHACVRRPALGFVGAWFFLSLGPSSSFIPRVDLAVEHRAYLATASVVTLVVLGTWSAWRRVPEATRGRFPRAPAVALALVALALAARTWARNADYADPVRLWRVTSEQAPWNARAHHNLATVLRDANDLEGALAAYDRALALDPARVSSLFGRAGVLARVGHRERAIADYGRIIELGGEMLAEAHANRGQDRNEQGDVAGALEDYDRAIELRPGWAHAWFGRGWVRQTRGDDARALADYERALALDPSRVEAYGNRATIFLRAGRLNDAQADLNRALRARPGWAEAYETRALVRLALGEIDGAWSDVKTARLLGRAVANDLVERLVRASGRRE